LAAESVSSPVSSKRTSSLKGKRPSLQLAASDTRAHPASPDRCDDAPAVPGARRL